MIEAASKRNMKCPNPNATDVSSRSSELHNRKYHRPPKKDAVICLIDWIVFYTVWAIFQPSNGAMSFACLQL